jgi:biopolymer transport protein ExbB
MRTAAVGRPMPACLGILAALGLAIVAAGAPPRAAHAGAPGPDLADTADALAGEQPAGPGRPIPGDRTAAYVVGALGPFYGAVFLGLAVSLGALMALNLVAAQRRRAAPPALVERLRRELAAGRPAEAGRLACNDQSALGRIVAAGVAAIGLGGERALEAMQAAADRQAVIAEHRLSYVALVATLSPMIGLLGTVQGMISSFLVIARRSTTPPPWELAGGISTALATTLVGLAIAIPAIAAHNVLRNRMARLALETGFLSEDLLGRLIRAAARDETA